MAASVRCFSRWMSPSSASAPNSPRTLPSSSSPVSITTSFANGQKCRTHSDATFCSRKLPAAPSPTNSITMKPLATTAKTKTDSAVVRGLNLLVADSYALMANTHVAHWNVEGPGFFSLHKAFHEQYEDLF